MLSSAKNSLIGNCHVTWGVVVVQHPSACNVWSHTFHRLPESFKEFPIKGLIDSLSWWYIFLVDDPLTVKKTNEHRFDFGFFSFSLSWDGENLQCATPNFGVLSRGRTPKSMIHHLCNETEEFWLPLKAVQKIKKHIPLIGLLLSHEVLWNHLGAHFSYVQILC